jgi:segregation and condensation protein A
MVGVSNEYTVQLQRVFQGPMDLLLHLVREQEVEIHEVEISRVIEGYLQYVQALQDLDIELAGDFTLMAATLMAIKSRSLLPQEEVDLEDELDPRDELIERLIEYRKFKEASDDLASRHAARAHQFRRGTFREIEEEKTEPTLDLGELTSWDLLAAFSRLMRETLADRPHRIAGEARPLRFYVQAVASRMRASGSSSLRGLIRELGDEASTRESLVGSFCALLELIRLGLVTADQDSPLDDISIRFIGDEHENLDDLIRAAQFEDEETEVEGLTGPAADEPPDGTGTGESAPEQVTEPATEQPAEDSPASPIGAAGEDSPPERES